MDESSQYTPLTPTIEVGTFEDMIIRPQDLPKADPRRAYLEKVGGVIVVWGQAKNYCFNLAKNLIGSPVTWKDSPEEDYSRTGWIVRLLEDVSPPDVDETVLHIMFDTLQFQPFLLHKETWKLSKDLADSDIERPNIFLTDSLSSYFPGEVLPFFRSYEAHLGLTVIASECTLDNDGNLARPSYFPDPSGFESFLDPLRNPYTVTKG